MFGLEGTGFTISVAVTLLLAGLVAFYCKQRLDEMDKKFEGLLNLNKALANSQAVIEQRMIDQAWNRGGNNSSPPNLNTENVTSDEGLSDTVKESNETDDRTVVSDGESSENSDSDSESESDSDSDDGSNGELDSDNVEDLDVKIGGVACLELEVENEGELKCVIPPGRGNQEIEVIVGSVSSKQGGGNKTFVTYAPPLVTRLELKYGPTYGNETVLISGEYLAHPKREEVGPAFDTEVTVAGVECVKVSIIFVT